MKQRGFTLFVAMVVTSTLVVISMGIIAFAVRQSLITSAGRESQYAFYAADTAAECALHWDVVGVPDAAQGPDRYSAFSPQTAALQVRCNQDNVTVGPLSNSLNHWAANKTRPVGANYVFTTLSPIRFLPNPYCASVTVYKYDSGATVIESKGYNTCTAVNSGRRVERSVRMTY
jgi:hypothetical protein